MKFFVLLIAAFFVGCSTQSISSEFETLTSASDDVFGGLADAFVSLIVQRVNFSIDETLKTWNLYRPLILTKLDSLTNTKFSTIIQSSIDAIVEAAKTEFAEENLKNETYSVFINAKLQYSGDMQDFLNNLDQDSSVSQQCWNNAEPRIHETIDHLHTTISTHINSIYLNTTAKFDAALKKLEVDFKKYRIRALIKCWNPITEISCKSDFVRVFQLSSFMTWSCLYYDVTL